MASLDGTLSDRGKRPGGTLRLWFISMPSPIVKRESLGQAPMCAVKAVFLDLQVD